MKLVSVRGALVLTLALAVALVGGASQIEAQGKGTIKIATQSPLSGGRAALSCKTLKDMGYPRVMNLGAFKDACEAGLETEPA